MFRVLMALALMVSPTSAQMKWTECMPQSQVLRFAMAENGYISHEIVSGDRRKFVVMVFNALPPVSDDDWPLVIIVDSTNGTGRILVGKDGQICNTAALPKVLWRALKLVLDGQPI